MKPRSLAIPIFILVFSLVAGCDALDSTDEFNPPRSLTQEEAAVVKSDNTFGLSLFTRLHAAKPDSNLFISPLSVSMALGMTLNGADGETRRQMAEALHKEGLSEEAINASYRSLIDLLTGLDPKVRLDIANSIWYREGFRVEPAFLDVNREHFDAEIQGLDFAEPEAVETINGWVEDKTEGLIDSIIEQIDRDVMMYLINAIYFKGQWTYEFDLDDTSDQPFANAGGTSTIVPMMSLHGSLPYASLENASVIDLPYGDSLYSMTIVLPHDAESIDEIAGSMTPDTWDEWTALLRPQELDLYLPRFDIAYFSSLKDVLKEMGMTNAFSGSADFSRIIPDEQLYISDVLHKTVLKVNEEGTEAAAVTAVEIRATSIGENIVFRVDHPFILAIRERNSGSILFAGKIMTL